MAKIIGEAAIRLRAEGKTLGPEIRRLVTTAVKEASAGIRADLRGAGDGLTDGIRQDAEKTSSSVKSILGGILSTLSSVSAAFIGTALKAAVLSVGIAGIASSLSGTAALVGGLGEAISGMGAAAIGVGVAGLTAMIALSATLKIATSGMGEAFKAVASGDAKALQEALKGMAPAAREFVTETAKLKPLFDEIRLATQAALFKGLGREVLSTGKALKSTFQRLFVGIAEQVNEAGTQILKFLREARTVKDLDTISDNVVGGFREMSQAGRSVTQIIVDIVKSSSELLPGLGRSIEDVTKKFAAFIRAKSDSGELTAFFQQGIETVKQFGRIIRDLGVGISNVFKIGSETGGGFLNILERAATSFREFTESAQGKEILTTIFQTIRLLAEAFGELLSTLRPVLKPLGELARILAEGIASALDRIGPKLRDTLIRLFENLTKAAPDLIRAVEKIIESVLELIDVLGPLAPAFADVVAEMAELSGPGTIAMVAALALIGGKIGLVVAAGVGLGLLLIEVGKKVHSFVNSVGDDIEGFGRDLQKLDGPFAILGKGIETFGSGVGTDAGKVREFLRKQGADIGQTFLESVASGIAAAQAEAVVPGVNRAVSQILSIFNGRKGEFTAAGGLTWGEVGRGITTEQQAVVDRLRQAAQALLNLLTGQRDAFATQGRTLSQALANGLTAGQQEAINRVRALLESLLGAMTGKRSSFDEEGRAISNRLGGGISAAQGDAVGAARSVGSAVVDTFSNASLFSAGAAIMASLRSGLVSGIQAVKNVLTSMTSLIPTWKGPESLDRVLLVPAGKAIMGGLISSIESEIPALRSVLATVTDEVATALSPPGGMTLDFRPGSASAGGTAGNGDGVGTFVLQQTNNMLPGADVNQFAAEVWRRGAQDLTSGNSALNVSQQSIQAGLAPPGSVVTVGM